MIKGVLFDMDGVLLDTERLGATLMPGVSQKLGYFYPASLYRRVMGTNQQARSDIYHEAFGADFPADKLESSFFQAMMDVAAAGQLPLKPGLKECFDGLRARRLKVALATSTERRVVETYRQSVPELRTIFDATVCGVEIPRSKPAPDIYLLAAQKLGLRPEECVGVEDSRNGLRSLRAAGCYSVMIPDMLPYEESLAPFVDARLKDLTELCGLIDRLNRA